MTLLPSGIPQRVFSHPLMLHVMSAERSSSHFGPEYHRELALTRTVDWLINKGWRFRKVHGKLQQRPKRPFIRQLSALARAK